MRGRQAVRRRRLLIASGLNRDQVRSVEDILDEANRARRHRRRQLQEWKQPA